MHLVRPDASVSHLQPLVTLPLTAEFRSSETGAAWLKGLLPCGPVILRAAPHIHGPAG
jgi:hypothetical protein